MPGYRAFKIDESGHIVSPPAYMNCNDDKVAIEFVGKMVDYRAIELWEGPRFVTKVYPPK
jgi:hypothetical protein